MISTEQCYELWRHSSEDWPNFSTCQSLFSLLGLGIFVPSSLTLSLSLADRKESANTQPTGAVLSPSTPTTRQKQAKTSVCMCAGGDATLLMETGRQQRDLAETEDSIGNLRYGLNFLRLTRPCSVVSLVNNDTAYFVSGELEENFGSDWECGEDCIRLSKAASDKHLTCCLHTSGATWTVEVSAQNNAELYNKLRGRTVVRKGSKPVDWPTWTNCYVAANTTLQQLTTNPLEGLADW